MSENSKSYRIKTTIGNDTYVSVNLEQDYDTFDILSMKLTSSDVYRLHNSNYGVVAGRVQANGGFGVPNAKISIFISADSVDSEEMQKIYSYSSSVSRGSDGVRYNLLPDEKVGDCHQIVGTFPNKRYLLDNDVIMEVFEKYYKYTTRTNNAGDYMICGVPTGTHTIHMDLDLSDCGILSQRPRDFIYKGYTVEQFENPNMFKTGTSYTNLSQIFTQDKTVYVQPFWGNEGMGETIGITRADIDVAYKFEPTCVFMGCIAGDNASNGISKKCIPTPSMGNMDELVTGKGTIEMIRKTYGGSVEEFQVKGTELIDGNGIWCYQIPMNLDYMITDEYGNMVPTDNPDKGIPTRTRVRFRISLQDMELNTENFFRPKVLVPHNPQNLDGVDHEDYDYEFGTYTKDESFRDLFWNNVYTVKSYIPRFQKRKVGGWKEDKFSGIKHVQNFGGNNPMPYNNIRIRLPFMFKVICLLVKAFIKVTGVVNTVISAFGNFLAGLGEIDIAGGILRALPNYVLNKLGKSKLITWHPFKKQYRKALTLKMNVIDEGLCPDLENWYFAPMFLKNLWTTSDPPKGLEPYNLLKQTLTGITTDDDKESIDDQNQDTDDKATCLTIRTDYLISCIEMNLAQEYKVINFDFYNDWINGLIYVPRFVRYMRKKRKFLGITVARAKIKGCMDDTKTFSKSRRYTQMCSMGFERQRVGNYNTYSKVTTSLWGDKEIVKSNNLHKKRGLTQQTIFKKNGGICHEKETIYGHHVYYFKPCEWTNNTSPLHRKINLFATDIVLLGSLNNCDLYGIPQAFKHLVGSSYIMPTNLALTNMEESGPLYSYGDKGTICSTGNQTTEKTELSELEKPVRVIPISGDTALYNELKFFSGASENYDTQYDDPSDTIAMTESAGIAWNYTGPGQGKIDKNKLYYPGGHFLGLSCVNSQTNIKSCINLERICELGVSMSQRREEVRDVNENDGDTKMEYTYIAPTGFISGEEIIDDDFRKMFATMNKNRLIADKVNPDNGYKVYDFQHSNPINFNGEFTKYAGVSTPYNQKITSVKEESNWLSKFGILPGNTRDDYDENETANTKTRTIEFPSIDYYMFRFGLTYDDVKKLKERHVRQFGKDKNGIMYLPQYENSFYFYFGLRDGSTALDEFNKQFFSECETSTLSQRQPSIYVSVDDFSICDGTSLVVPYVRNMEPPLIINIDGERHIYEDENDIEGFTLSIGQHKIIVTDANGSEATLEFSVGAGVIGGSFEKYDFNKIWQNTSRGGGSIFEGGYILGTDVKINIPEDDEETEISDLKLVAVAEGGNPAGNAEKSVTVVEGGDTYLYLNSANTPYDIYVSYRCNGGNAVYLKISSFTLLDTSTLNLTMGPVLATEYKELAGDAMTPDNWWRSYLEDTTGSFLAWDIKKSILYPYGKLVPFSSHVRPINGLKWLFGSPQSVNGVYINENEPISSAEYDIAIPDGYSLDDDASYYATLTINEKPERPIYNYNAMTVNDSMVCGNYASTITNKNGMTKALDASSSLLREGDGCIFKPVPYGNVMPAYVNPGGGSITLFGDDDEGGLYENGVVYPTINYPVIKKHFEVKVNYFEIMDTKLEMVTDTDGISKPTAVSEIRGEKIEADIMNGVTFKQCFAGDSYITGIYNRSDNSDNEGKTQINVGPLPDYMGLTANRSKQVSGFTDERIDDPSFGITEGFPYYVHGNDILAYKILDTDTLYENYNAYKAEAVSVELKMGSAFHNTMYYQLVGNDEIRLWGDSEGGYDNITYYLVPFEGRSDDIFYEDNYKYVPTYPRISLFNSPKMLYVLGYFEEGAIYDTYGGDIIIQIADEGRKIKAYLPWTEETDDGDSDNGESDYKIHAIKVSKQNRIRIGDLERYLAEASASTMNMPPEKGKPKIGFRKSIKILSTVVSGGTWSMSKAIKSRLDRSSAIVPGEPMSTRGADRFIVIGVQHFEDENGNANGNVYRIYLDPVASNTLEGRYALALFIDNPSDENAITMVTVGSSGETVEIYAKVFSAATDYTISPTSESNFFDITYGGGSTDADGTQYVPVSITVYPNENEEERERKIELTWQGPPTGTTTLVIYQRGGHPGEGGEGDDGEQSDFISPSVEIEKINDSNDEFVVASAEYGKNIEYIKLTSLPMIEVKNITGSVSFWYTINGNMVSREVTASSLTTGLLEIPLSGSNPLSINSNRFDLVLHCWIFGEGSYEILIKNTQKATYKYKFEQ